MRDDFVFFCARGRHCNPNEINKLRKFKKRYKLLKSNVRNGSFGNTFYDNVLLLKKKTSINKQINT
jgi:hypothetical protein